MAGTEQPNFGFLITDIARGLRADFGARARARELGLTEAQWRALAHLARMEGCRQAELAERLDVRPITLARLVDRLESAGLVERRPRPGDRRAVQLVLTAKARPIVRRMWALGAETRERAFSGLGVRERRALLGALERVRENLAAETQAAAGQAAIHGR